MIATRVGDRAVAFTGLLIAAGGYVLISHWPVDLPHYGHNIFGFFTLPAMQTDLLTVGLGLGLVIGPLTSAALRVVPAAEHGIASAAVVVSRMTGMLIGVAGLGAWGLYRFYQILNEKNAAIPSDVTGTDRALEQAHNLLPSFAAMYGEIFTATWIVCVVGALLGLLIGGRKEHADGADEPESTGRHAAVPVSEAPAANLPPG